MSRLCVDTSAYSRLKRGDDAVKGCLEEADEVLVPATVLGELHAGFERGTMRRRNAEELRAFLDTPGTSVRNADEGVAERYGHLVKQLREQGTPIPTNDIWIAATALESGARLLTCDSHFTHVAGIMTESP